MIKMKSLALALLAGLVLTADAGDARAQPNTPSVDEPLDTEAVDEALELYWGQQRKITPLERRNHDHAWRHELTVFGAIVPNDRFSSFYPLGARYDLFLHNDFAAELWGAYLLDVDSELNKFYNKHSNLGETMLGSLPPKIAYMGGLSLVWSPIHGKLAAFSSKLTHFDIFFASGLTVLGTTSEEVCSGIGATKECTGGDAIAVGGHVGVGFRVQMLQWAAVKLEYRQHFYDAKGGATWAPSEFSLGLSFWSPGDEG